MSRPAAPKAHGAAAQKGGGYPMNWFDGFDGDRFAVNDTEIFARFGGSRGKPALLLLRGFFL